MAGIGRRGALMAGTAILLLAQPAAGQVVWEGTVDASWTNGGNWSGGVAPADTDNVIVDGFISVRLDGAAGEAGDLTVGNSGLAGLLVTNDATLTTEGVVTIGNLPNSNGFVEVRGENSKWEANSTLILIGDSGLGGMYILEGGTLTNAGDAEMGWGANASGSVVVSGTGSTWENTGTIRVGISGQGDLLIEDGGHVQSNTVAVGNSSSNHESTVLVDNATWAVSELVTGSARIEVRNGAVVTNSGIGATFGTQNGMHTDLIVDGATWTTAGPMTVGRQGSAVISVLNGGTLNTGGTPGSTTLGSFETGRGEIVVSGIGSTWTANGALRVGESGEGILTIADQAEATAMSSVRLGQDETGMGYVHVRDEAEWHLEQELIVGASGGGELTITGGGGVHVGEYLVIADDGTAEGAVIVDGAGSLLDVAETIDVGATGKGSLTISNGGEVSVGTGEDIHIAANAGSEGVLNIGAAAGEIAQGAGILSGDRIVFHNGDGTLVFNHTGTEADGYTFGAALESTGMGSHAIEHLAGVTNYTGDGSGFTGTTTISGGTLYVNDALGGIIDVNGGVLGGIGTLGDVTINSGGTIAPGNSIGTLYVTSVVFNPGSTYEIEIQAPNLSDLISATGTATINGGDLAITALDTGTSYADGQTYRIVEAGGGVVHNADFTHNQPLSLMRTEVIYGADFVDLLLTADIPFTTFAQTYNQFQAATGLQDMEQSGDALTVYNEIVQLSLQPNGQEAVRRAFDLSSGEMHASGQHVIDQTFGLFSRTLRGQASAGIGGGTAGGQVFTAPLAYGPTSPAGPGVAAIDDATTSAYANERVAQAWVASLGGRGVVDADGNAGKLDYWTLGIAGGYEGPIDVASGEAYAGFGLGYLRSHGSVDARLSTMNADGFHIGAYGGWTDGPWSLAGSLAYAANRISTERRIVFGAINQTAEADYWSHTIGFSGEAAYGFDIGGGTTISPLFTLDAGWSGHGGFTETGAGALGLTGASESWTRLDTGLGLAVSHVVLTETGKVTLDGRLLWEHAFADVMPSQNLAFAGSPTAFTVNGPDAGRDRVRLGLGVSFEATEDMTIRAGYTGLFSGNQQSHGASLGLNVKF